MNGTAFTAVTLIDIALAGAALWLLALLAMLLAYRRELQRIVGEPVFRYPVLVIESDDWGAGPLAQAEALRELAATLAARPDARGQPAVLSLALVLAVPDGEALRAGDDYRRLELDHPLFAPVLQALRDGEAAGVFALQLHGLEHYWPPALLASTDPAVQDWLRADAPAISEALPSPLQSRWVDASSLPSNPLDQSEVRSAVADECRTFARIFGRVPSSVVPPTFVWTETVEDAWAAAGVRCISTPGWRYTMRGADGLPGGDEGPLWQGVQRGALIYLARCDYFEPLRGRDATHALRVLARQARQGQPCVLENHRDNFITGPAERELGLAELARLLDAARTRHPGLRFAASSELARVLRQGDVDWLLGDWRAKLPAWWQRVAASGRLWKLLRASGAALLAGSAVRLLSRRA